MELSLEKILKLVWKNILVLALATIICAMSAFFITKHTIPNTYVSTIGFTIISTASDTNVENPSYLSSNLSYIRQIVSSKVAMLDTLDYYTMVASQLNSDIDLLIEQHPEMKEELEASKKTPSQISRAVSFRVLADTELFNVVVTTNSAGESKMIADSIVATANVHLTQLARPDNALAGETVATDTVRCYETPIIGVLSGPNVMANTFMGFVAGFFITLLAIIVIDMLDKRIKSIGDLSDRFGDIPVLGMVASFKASKK